MSNNNNTMSSSNNNVSSNSLDNVELEDIVNTFETLVVQDQYLVHHNQRAVKIPIKTHRERIKTFGAICRSETYQQSKQFDEMLKDLIYDGQCEVATKLLNYVIMHIRDEHLHARLYVYNALRRCLKQLEFDVLSLIMNNIDLFQLEPVDAYIVKAVVRTSNLECMKTLFSRQNFENMEKVPVRTLTTAAYDNGDSELALYLLCYCNSDNCGDTDCSCYDETPECKYDDSYETVCMFNDDDYEDEEYEEGG